MQFYWTPQDSRRADAAGHTARPRLGRFLTGSTAVHVAGAALSGWLSLSLLPPRPSERLLVRTIDFVEPAPAPRAAPAGNRRQASELAGGASIRAPRPGPAARPTAPARPSAPARPAAAAPPASAPAAPSEPAVPPARPDDVGDMPTPAPSAEEARIAAATPKAIGSAGARGPASVSTPPRDSSPQPSAVPGVVTGAEGGGPMATVALPPGLVRGTGGGGSGTATGGAGAGAGGMAGTGGAGGGTGAGVGVDPGDPDFSEYFRVIERRVRAAWKFPESLGGTTQTVKIGFALAPEGSLREARVVSSSSRTLNDSALSAMKRAAPFPPLPDKFRALAGQPLVMSFTVIIR
jgi:translation initiation factor IF-2